MVSAALSIEDALDGARALAALEYGSACDFLDAWRKAAVVGARRIRSSRWSKDGEAPEFRAFATDRLAFAGEGRGATLEAATVALAKKLRAADHRRDEDCDVGPDRCCVTCGVAHGEPCSHCGQRAFHRLTCPELDR